MKSIIENDLNDNKTNDSKINDEDHIKLNE